MSLVVGGVAPTLWRTTIGLIYHRQGADNMGEMGEERDMNPVEPNGELDRTYRTVFDDVSRVIDAARESAARSVNAAMNAAYWLIGRRIVEFEQSGAERTEYRTALLERLSVDLTGRFGRGFSRQNVQNMRLFYLAYPPDKIRQTLSGKLGQPPGRQILQTPSGESDPSSVKKTRGPMVARIAGRRV